MSELYIGLMSGTSMDGVDGALVAFHQGRPEVKDFISLPYPKALLQQLHALCQPGEDEINRLGNADRAVSAAFSQVVLTLLERNKLSASQIAAIGSHGQTIRHHPQGKTGFTLQIGDPNSLAVATNIRVIADFRRKDVALGGQGAPLVPAFHHAVFANPGAARAVVNIGGIANISYLGPDDQVSGWDTGPGNCLMDAWIRRQKELAYDKDGAWAAQGEVDEPLLKELLAHPYFASPPPKSTGRELFNLGWLDSVIASQGHSISPVDVQATLLALTTSSLADSLRPLNAEHIYLCGGGAHNSTLRQALGAALPDCRVEDTAALNIHPDTVEAAAFAWLAWCFDHKQPGNLPGVTGAARKAVLGALYPAD
ncbi:anhydro-N-acetylmuramic acid kinase [Aliiglaciecola sp. CAU 1673]|uniref:anhydro-N-acetylmuramic acid kinase n=1 Tax=Aliiglaciecola sp. CAU 1673 TaxID=3032595 RepID=UPI0023DCC00A|nr:anhydro-N-acetylmuramic acid kinase [Aliiglaciecola sp. CAU 1673]MDF2178521.1 anhydro-N-acetylmuramic acid kinase [Aliiglaciecola sp. CAU 1673]